MQASAIFHAVNDEGGIVMSETGVGNYPVEVIVSKIMRMQNLNLTSRVVVLVDRNWRMLGIIKENTYYSAEWEWPEETKH